MNRVIKILFLAANPSDTTRLRLDEEVREIDLVLQKAKFRDRFDIKQQWAVRVTDLQSHLLRHTPDIVHFSGHGSRFSEIVLEDSVGNSHSVSTCAISELFSVLKDDIRCVLLNACYSENQAQAIAEHIDCVIGMSKAFGDRAAVSFATAFYQALGYGRDVRTAFDLGCVQIDLENLKGRDIPRLIAINQDPREMHFAPQEIAHPTQSVSSFESSNGKDALRNSSQGKATTGPISPDLEADMARLRMRRNQAEETRLELQEDRIIVNLCPLDMRFTFKNRSREIKNFCRYLTEEGVRFVGVFGRGGIGKTALVSYVLGSLEYGKPTGSCEALVDIDGIIYLDARNRGLSLERIYDGVRHLLGQSADKTLSARWTDDEVSATAKVEHLLRSMKQGTYIILLDNLEDELTEEGKISQEGLRIFVERCLAQPTGVRLVATSRREPKLPPASLQRVRHLHLHSGLPEDDAIDLLRELDPQGELGLRNASDQDLRRAVQLTQGIPRALEMFAGILYEDPTLDLSHLLAEEQLEGEQVTDQLAAEGYHRLRDAEQRVLEALAVFNRPVEATAVAYLLYPWFPELSVLEPLRRLTKSYFVKSNRSTGEYSIHPVDRDYAYHQIAETNDTSRRTEEYSRRNLELRAADFYADLVEPESKWLTTNDLQPKLREFEHRVNAADYDDAARIVNQIDHNYLSRWGHLELALSMRQRIADTISNQSLRRKNLCDIGVLLHELGRQQEAIGYHQRALELARTAGDIREEQRNLSNIGVAYRNIGEYDRAVDCHQIALSIARRTDNKQAQHSNLGSIGKSLYNMGEITSAVDYLEAALKVARSAGDKNGECRHLEHLGMAHLALGRYDRAIDLNQQALEIARDGGYRRRESIALGHLGWISREIGQYHRASEYHSRSLTIAHEIGARVVEAHRLAGLAEANLAMGRLDIALNEALEALRIADEVMSPRQQQRQGTMLSQIYLRLRKLDKALSAIAVARQYNRMELNHRSALLHGIVLARLNRTEEACEALNESLKQAGELLARAPGHCKANYVLGMALSGLAILDTDSDKRRDYRERAECIFRDARGACNAKGLVEDTLSLLSEIQELNLERKLLSVQDILLASYRS